MKFSIKISRKIISDIDRAVEWYESKEKGLGEKFENEFLTKISRIKDNPKLFQEVETDYRRAVIGPSFPYTIHFLVNEKTRTVKIIRVLHQSKNIELVKEEARLEHIQNIADRKDLSQSRLKSLEHIKNSKNIARGKGLEL